MSRELEFIEELRGLVGKRHVRTDRLATLRFTRGYRYGSGDCAAVVQPGSLVEMWQVLQSCVRNGAAIVMQAANTGLTGGSTPSGTYDRQVIVVNTLRLSGVRIIRRGEQVVCLAGSTLHELERAIRPFDREPHSVIGSSCIGASVVGGICNNSGGALVRRGPAYTELALFARVNASGELELVNHLGIDLGEEPDEILNQLDGAVSLDGLVRETDLCASDQAYVEYIRDFEAPTPARFNADIRRLFEASGSAGKVAIFAVRLDTFPREARSATFYIGTNSPGDLEALRRRILTSPGSLPIACEYLHRDAFNLAERYGKDMFLALRVLGTERIRWLFKLRSAIDGFAMRIGWLQNAFSDKVAFRLARIFPSHLPARMLSFRDAFEHHLLLKVGEAEIEATRRILRTVLADDTGDFFECTPDEADKAFRHRFVTAGAAIRYRAVHREDVEDIVALDVALRRNDADWTERLPEALASKILHAVYYGHFACHVFHQDYILRKGVSVAEFEEAVCAILDGRGAEYPAEHNVGHLYPAKPPLEAHYRAIDPHNVFNPGIGRLARRRDWAH
jgi:D-lactate dehydrogenase